MDGSTDFVDEYFGALKEKSDDLQQWGVKGMKWGVRRSDKELASARGERVVSDDAKAHSQRKALANTYGSSSLSTKDLQEYVNRTNLEQQYAKLTAPQKSKGRKFVEETLKDIGRSEVKGLTKGKPAPIASLIIGAATKGKYKPKHAKG